MDKTIIEVEPKGISLTCFDLKISNKIRPKTFVEFSNFFIITTSNKDITYVFLIVYNSVTIIRVNTNNYTYEIQYSKIFTEETSIRFVREFKKGDNYKFILFSNFKANY